MIAKDRGRGWWLSAHALAALALGTAALAHAQQGTVRNLPVPPPAPQAKANEQFKVDPKDTNVPALKPTAIPVNPGDPIAIVNNQIISRQQLADECIAREGKKVLELLINRSLIDQALPPKNSKSRPRRSIKKSTRSPGGTGSVARAGYERSTRNEASAPCSTHATSSIPPSPCAS